MNLVQHGLPVSIEEERFHCLLLGILGTRINFKTVQFSGASDQKWKKV
jgi:hypothetical protein